MCVAGNTSSLEPQPRRSARCAFRRALLCSVSPRSSTVVLPPLPALRRRSSHVAALHESALPEHLRVGRSWFVAMVWLSPASASGLQSRRSSVVATLRSCRRCGCVPRGQRALLDADMLELIDRSTCLVEPVSVESCAPPPVLVLFPAASTSSAASGRCSRMSFPRGLVEGLLLPESSLRAAPVASLRLLLLDDRDLSPVVHVSLCSLTYFCMYSILGHILRVSTPSQPSVLIQSDCALSMACAPSVSCETTAACLISNSTSGCSSSDTLCNIHDRVMFHRCCVDCGHQDKCIQPSFNVRLNSCCCIFTGSPSLSPSSFVCCAVWTMVSFTQAYHHDSLLSFLFASELETEPVCPQPLCVLVVTSVDKLLSQLVRLVHRSTSITADLVHTRLTIRLAAVELDPDVHSHLLRLLQSFSESCLARSLHTVVTLLTGPPVLSFPLAQGNTC